MQLKRCITFSLLLTLFTSTGCTLLQTENTTIYPKLPKTASPIVGIESKQIPTLSKEELNQSEILPEWQIELVGDPGVQLDIETYFPPEKLSFIVTFNREMDRTSVEEAFQRNLFSQAQEVQDLDPASILEFNWINPIQVEVAFNGEKAKSRSIDYTISPQGAFTKEGNRVLEDQKKITFRLAQKSMLYQIDKKGELSKPIADVPFSLTPVSISPNGTEMILQRTISYQGNDIIPYLYDLKSKKIVKIYPKRSEAPFWGNDHKLYTLTENSLIAMSDEDEQWIEFGEYPYIHGWSISPDLRYEVFLLSKSKDQETRVTLLMKDLLAQSEQIYENLLPMNDLDADHKQVFFPLTWIPNKNQLFIESFGTNKKDWLFDPDTGKLSEAPKYLQADHQFFDLESPKWSKDGRYVALINSGIYSSEGKLQYDWGINPPTGALYWNPQSPVIAYESYSGDEKRIIQYNVETGKTISTKGNFTILGWTPDGISLLVYREE